MVEDDEQMHNTGSNFKCFPRSVFVICLYS